MGPQCSQAGTAPCCRVQSGGAWLRSQVPRFAGLISNDHDHDCCKLSSSTSKNDSRAFLQSHVQQARITLQPSSKSQISSKTNIRVFLSKARIAGKDNITSNLQPSQSQDVILLRNEFLKITPDSFVNHFSRLTRTDLMQLSRQLDICIPCS